MGYIQRLNRLEETVERFSHPVSVERRKKGFYAEGQYNKLDPSCFSTTGSLQPTTAKELQTLPEGMRTDGAVTIWIRCKLYVGGKDCDFEPDIVCHEGRRYEARSELDWFHYGKFRRYVAIKAGQ